ncbi:MAG: efflux RND transporter periplasmic adaptor subunit [Betaproteobacteria bacterium]|nr:efflux RND transporter periplasmic adaptor subunit [Betaproteobacteria bacterium]
MDVVKDPQLIGAAARSSSRAHGAGRRGFRRRAIALALAIALAGGGYAGWRAWASPADAAAQLTTATVQRASLEDSVTATGALQPRDYVDVGTQVSGQLKKLHVEIGSTVKSGQLLAEIDPTVYLSRVDADRAQLANLRAQLVDREAQLVLAEQQFKRQTNLMREQATTSEALQTAEAQLASAKAQLEVLKAQIQQAGSTLRGDEASLSYTKIYAPMAGTVVAQSAKQGQMLNANQQAPIIVRIADLSTMTIQSQVSEADVSRLEVGMDVYFTTLGNGQKRWQGKLRQINPTPEIINNVVLYNALFDVANPDGALMTQMTAQIFFVVAKAEDALLIPLAALRPAGGAPGNANARRSSGDGNAKGTGAARTRTEMGTSSATDPRAQFAGGRARVRVMTADGSTQAREVQVGVMNRVSAQVLSGLEAGEQVIVGQRSSAPAAARPARSATQSMMPRGRI